MKCPHFVVLFLLLTVSAPALFSQTRPDALAEYRQSNYQRAVEICLDEIAADASNMDSYVVLCWSLISLRRYNEALQYARTARSLNRFDSRVSEIMGEIFYYLGNNNEALQFFQEYVNLAPNGSRVQLAYYYIGEIYIRMGRFRHADIALSTAVHWAPGNAAWWTRLGFARENAGDLTQAITAYERALALNAQLPDARRGLDRTRQSLGGR